MVLTNWPVSKSTILSSIELNTSSRVFSSESKFAEANIFIFCSLSAFSICLSLRLIAAKETIAEQN